MIELCPEKFLINYIITLYMPQFPIDSIYKQPITRKSKFMPPSPHIPKNFMSQQLKPNRTFKLQKLKSQLSDYLNKKTIAKNEEVLFYTPEKTQYTSQLKHTFFHNHKSVSQQSKYQKKVHSTTKNKYIDNKQTKRRKYMSKQSNKTPESSVEAISRQSFMIRQIKPQTKQNFYRSKKIVATNIGKVYGSYYQIVALQKQFQNSKYFWKNSWLKADQGRSDQGKSPDPQNRTSNPEEKKQQERIKIEERMMMGQASQIEPWKSMEQSIIELE